MEPKDTILALPKSQIIDVGTFVNPFECIQSDYKPECFPLVACFEYDENDWKVEDTTDFVSATKSLIKGQPSYFSFEKGQGPIYHQCLVTVKGRLNVYCHELKRWTGVRPFTVIKDFSVRRTVQWYTDETGDLIVKPIFNEFAFKESHTTTKLIQALEKDAIKDLLSLPEFSDFHFLLDGKMNHLKGRHFIVHNIKATNKIENGYAIVSGMTPEVYALSRFKDKAEHLALPPEELRKRGVQLLLGDMQIQINPQTLECQYLFEPNYCHGYISASTRKEFAYNLKDNQPMNLRDFNRLIKFHKQPDTILFNQATTLRVIFDYTLTEKANHNICFSPLQVSRLEIDTQDFLFPHYDTDKIVHNVLWQIEPDDGTRIAFTNYLDASLNYSKYSIYNKDKSLLKDWYFEYIHAHKKYPVLEGFLKLKAYDLVIDGMFRNIYTQKRTLDSYLKQLAIDETIDVNNELNPIKFLGIPKTFFHLLIKEDEMDFLNVRTIQRLLEEEKQLNRPVLTLQLLEELLTGGNYNLDFFRGHRLTETIQLLRKGYTLEKLKRYLDRLYFYEVLSVSDAQQYLIDYIRMSEAMGIEEIELYPRYLQITHDLMARNFKYKKSAIIESKVKERAVELEPFAYENERYKIIIPSCADDFVKEGNELRHCVGSYIERYANRETTVVFLRKKNNPNQSYVTIEYRNERIVQAEGKRNQYQIPKEVNQFINQWLQHANKVNQELRVCQ